MKLREISQWKLFISIVNTLIFHLLISLKKINEVSLKDIRKFIKEKETRKRKND